jgi:hypothetical protein
MWGEMFQPASPAGEKSVFVQAEARTLQAGCGRLVSVEGDGLQAVHNCFENEFGFSR